MMSPNSESFLSRWEHDRNRLFKISHIYTLLPISVYLRILIVDCRIRDKKFSNDIIAAKKFAA